MMNNFVHESSTSGRVIGHAENHSEQFGDYQEIASLGYCQVCKAQRYGQWFVLKSLKTEFVNNPDYQEMLHKEFTLMLQLQHPNIVWTYGLENDASCGLSIVMEYVDGRTLQDFLQENPAEESKQQIVSQLLDAIQYCHARQIIHQDLKPSNILITYNGNNVKIIDFGLSDSDNFAILKGPAYTKAYAAPEQIEGDAVDCRADIYAFGLLLKQLFPKRYSHVVKRCLQPKREKRYSSTREITKAIGRSDLRRKKIPIILLMLIVLCGLALSAFHFISYIQKKNTGRPHHPAEAVNAYTTTKEIVDPIEDLTEPKISQNQQIVNMQNAVTEQTDKKRLMQQVQIFSQKLDSIYSSFERDYKAEKILYSDIALDRERFCQSEAIIISLQMEYELFTSITERNEFDLECCKLLQKKNIRYAKLNELPSTNDVKNHISDDEYARLQKETEYWSTKSLAAGQREIEVLEKYR